MKTAADATWRETKTFADLQPAYVGVKNPEQTESYFWSANQAGGQQALVELQAARSELGSGVGRRVFEEQIAAGAGVAQALQAGRDAAWLASPEFAAIQPAQDPLSEYWSRMQAGGGGAGDSGGGGNG
jgi:hypothetical protein